MQNLMQPFKNVLSRDSYKMNINTKIDEYFSKFETPVTVDQLPSVKGFLDFLNIDKAEFDKLNKNEKFVEDIYQGLMKIRKDLYFTLLDFLSFTDTKPNDTLIIKTLKQELVESFFYNIEELK